MRGAGISFMHLYRKQLCNSKELRSKPQECSTVKLFCVFCAFLIERGHGCTLLIEGACGFGDVKDCLHLASSTVIALSAFIKIAKLFHHSIRRFFMNFAARGYLFLPFNRLFFTCYSTLTRANCVTGVKDSPTVYVVFLYRIHSQSVVTVTNCSLKKNWQRLATSSIFVVTVTENDLCSPNPCNSGTCVSKVGRYYCKCPRGVAGYNCTRRESLVFL